MTKEELIKKRNELVKSFQEKYESLGEVFADERCPVKVGDIVRGAGVFVKVEKIYYNATACICGIDCIPYCSFYGTVVNKDGVPYKNNPKKSIYPWALKEVNGKKVKYDYND